jgi:hypothetical protein
VELVSKTTIVVNLVVVLAIGCKNDSKQEVAPEPTPVATRIDAVGIEVELAPSWKPGGPDPVGPHDASYYRGSSPDEPDAMFVVSNLDTDLSEADDDRLLFMTKTVGGQVKRSGGTCEVTRVKSRRVGRCQIALPPLDKAVYAIPVDHATYTLLFMSKHDQGASPTAEADAIVASLRATK